MGRSTVDDKPSPFTRPSGSNVEFPNSVVGFVKLFVTDDFLQMIVEQTNLYAEHRYSSFALFKTLQDHDTLACGTVRKLRAKFPATMVNKKLTRGDKKDVFFLSTIHRPHLFSTKKTDKDGEIVMKDNIVTEYNKNMAFVDKNDQILTQHSLVRKCTKWTT